ncbi:MAG: SRPBCC family protein [Opitutaceae bacterium]
MIGVLLIASRQPDEFVVARTATLAAPPATVFAHVDDLHLWQAWSPWARMDPNAKSTFDGPPAGTGAVFSWEGNSKVGKGRMTIVESRPHELIRFRLDFEKPFKNTCTAEFTFRPEDAMTTVTWTMCGKANLMSKIMGLLMNCDKMVGSQFEQGFANLKGVLAASV